MAQIELLRKIKKRLKALYGNRFKGLVLYGSDARGDATDESDIDLLCLLDGKVDPVKEIAPIINAISSLQNAYPDRAISIKAISIIDFEKGSFPLCIEAKKEGVFV